MPTYMGNTCELESIIMNPEKKIQIVTLSMVIIVLSIISWHISRTREILQSAAKPAIHLKEQGISELLIYSV